MAESMDLDAGPAPDTEDECQLYNLIARACWMATECSGLSVVVDGLFESPEAVARVRSRLDDKSYIAKRKSPNGKDALFLAKTHWKQLLQPLCGLSSAGVAVSAVRIPGVKQLLCYRNGSATVYVVLTDVADNATPADGLLASSFGLTLLRVMRCKMVNSLVKASLVRLNYGTGVRSAAFQDVCDYFAHDTALASVDHSVLGGSDDLVGARVQTQTRFIDPKDVEEHARALRPFIEASTKQKGRWLCFDVFDASIGVELGALEEVYNREFSDQASGFHLNRGDFTPPDNALLQHSTRCHLPGLRYDNISSQCAAPARPLNDQALAVGRFDEFAVDFNGYTSYALVVKDDRSFRIDAMPAAARGDPLNGLLELPDFVACVAQELRAELGCHLLSFRIAYIPATAAADPDTVARVLRVEPGECLFVVDRRPGRIEAKDFPVPLARHTPDKTLLLDAVRLARLCGLRFPWDRDQDYAPTGWNSRLLRRKHAGGHVLLLGVPDRNAEPKARALMSAYRQICAAHRWQFLFLVVNPTQQKQPWSDATLAFASESNAGAVLGDEYHDNIGYGAEQGSPVEGCGLRVLLTLALGLPPVKPAENFVEVSIGGHPMIADDCTGYLYQCILDNRTT